MIDAEMRDIHVDAGAGPRGVQVQAEYRRLDRLLGIDTSGIPVRFSKRMTRQYGVCTFLKNRPQEIRLADFLRQEDAVFWGHSAA